MSYIDDTLLDDEKCYYRIHPHWIVYGLSVALFIFSFVLYFNLIGVLEAATNMKIRGVSFSNWMALLLFVLALCQLLVAWLTRKTSEYGITNKRILMKKGFIQRDTIELFLNKIEAVYIDQSILGRVFNYGTVVIVGTGGSRDPFAYVPEPLVFRKKVQEQIDHFMQEMRS